MPSFLEITSDKLSRIVGTPGAPTLIDVRIDEDFDADPRLLPGSVTHDYRTVGEWGPSLTGSAVIICQQGRKLSHGVAAHLRHAGIVAEVLEGGFEAWRQADGLLVPEDKLPRRDDRGRTVWVTRSRPKIDRYQRLWNEARRAF